MSAGYTDLEKIAAASPEEMISDTARVIAQNKSDVKAPLLKEVKTHIGMRVRAV